MSGYKVTLRTELEENVERQSGKMRARMAGSPSDHQPNQLMAPLIKNISRQHVARLLVWETLELSHRCVPWVTITLLLWELASSSAGQKLTKSGSDGNYRLCKQEFHFDLMFPRCSGDTLYGQQQRRESENTKITDSRFYNKKNDILKDIFLRI